MNDSNLANIFANLMGDADPAKLETVVQDAVILMQNKQILANHKHPISPIEGGKRWMTYVYDENGKRRSIKRTTKESVEQEVIVHYRNKDKMKKPQYTLESLYPDWRDKYCLDLSGNTIRKNESVWVKRLQNTAIVKEDIQTLSVPDLRAALIEISMKDEMNKMTKRQFNEMKGIVNGIYDYAVEKGIVATNTSRAVKFKSYRNFCAGEKVKDVEDQVFYADEELEILKHANKKYRETGKTIYLAIVLNFLLGCRAGELVAIEERDIDFNRNTIHLHQAEVADCRKDENGKPCMCGYVIAPGLKSGHSERTILLPPQGAEIIREVMRVNKARGQSGGYLFITEETGNRTRAVTLHTTLRSINKELKLHQRGNHCIRKTVTSELIEKGLLTAKQITDQMGHKDYATTQKYYAFVLKSQKQRVDEIEASVTNEFFNELDFSEGDAGKTA